MTYAGFDRADCPPLATMAALRAQTNLVWCGYYLRAPSQPASTWRGKRAALVAQGWGLAPIYVGQQVTGPGSHVVTAAQGQIDGAEACADLAAEGFPPGSWVYLDLEEGPPLTDARKAYIKTWYPAVTAGGYQAGVYCSFLFAAAVAALLPNARIWVYHVQTVSAHDVGGVLFPVPYVSLSGYPGATIWQRDDSALLMAFGGLLVDLDVSTVPDPGAPDARAAPVAQGGVPAPAATIGDVDPHRRLQALANALGASPPLDVDGDVGDKTIAAVNAILTAALAAKSAT